MTETDAFTADDLAKGEEHLALGPAYFAARRVVEGALENFQAEHVEPWLKEATDALYEKLLGDVQNYLWSNAEMNLQGECYRMVDRCVLALLSGEEWAVRKYALGERYDCEKVREAIARHVPKELQDARIADMEDELKRLREDLKWHRNR